MQKLGSRLHLVEANRARRRFHNYVVNPERGGSLFCVPHFCTSHFSIKKGNPQREFKGASLCERRQSNSFFSKARNNCSVDGKGRNEIFFERMEKKNSKTFHLTKQSVSSDKATTLDSAKGGQVNEAEKEKNGKTSEEEAFLKNGNEDKMASRKGEKQNSDPHASVIDLELSELWSKKTLILNFKNSVFEIILNRPEKLNAINKDMINGLLNIVKSLNNDDRCHIIVIKSSNTACFCSGSDVKDIVQNKEKGMQHLKQLYMYIHYLSKMKKPILCIWNGYAMGGGLGISMYAKFRIINKNAIFAMPENKIGFFPDITCCYFFKKYFGRNIGLHLGLTSLRLNEVDLVNFKICSNYVEDVDELLNHIYKIGKTNQDEFDAELASVLDKYPPKVTTDTKPVLTEKLISNIDKYYSSATSLDDLVSKLKKDQDDNPFCKETLDAINQNCYSSCNLWFEYFLYSYDKPLEEVLDNDFKITQHFLYHTDTFEKGVTELLVKKNKSFKWSSVRDYGDLHVGPSVEDILTNSGVLSIRGEFT
ncbi:3-hydroxyisobutyryl-coenzyme A hydrolase, putative [Plasmodium knowlesi strain H]|uniref:3-hydroxyisobutyryl-CoA hydrolase n=3 Tax=Plasmodium knowlesi TaxID=5850 RepID=A0A5K1US70_PLAKH|nr:3-hydroxyisobutyryl-coenzyme A hydrolase, putative [Plasmodium knowlesi strain H]OTN63726.1 3-hydroxyisobutyryl-CoA hydrolase - mitochondrial [Plasmodium knowlesi]CAA9991198.1 3-hydroxyisobutyryl-coenzyme A hydrolase, putative [Plasmodium knowlesi strain H]SBO26252.1 3-hydroxyisobutyryl-coenzyme A hydrolase, putative [Plasmodium knowlesi strain H]SBO29405.1 3-hydroxyisobutyryl-coenzyme A hydrolase, putative [Plasmodium knowlesi strain H]VVS80672.1 3-hydroxyisobutyryl-coenzyme A hydrolase, p|eukprot:XP_002262481.1 3-hydroxyisobutyryl-coenzyme a hydrolase,putative [Plasmodium knowlesi strain H]